MKRFSTDISLYLRNDTRQSYSYSGRLVSRMRSIERRHFRLPWTTINPAFKVTLLFDSECLRNGMRYTHSYNKILIEICTHPSQGRSWPWVILSDLATYSARKHRAISLQQLSFLSLYAGSATFKSMASFQTRT